LQLTIYICIVKRRTTVATKKAAARTPKTRFTVPKHPAKAGDLLYEIREKRYALNKEVAELAEQESQLREFIIRTLPKGEASGVCGSLARVEVTTKDIPQLKDKTKFLAYIKKTGQFDLMQIRISDTAVKDRWENKKTVPGVEAFPAVVVSCTKR
jgi:hypothetical protein